jgi:hypothetical protein
MVQQSEVERQARLALLLPSMMSMPLRVCLPSPVGYSTRSLAYFQFEWTDTGYQPVTRKLRTAGYHM